MEWYHVCWPRLTAKRVEPVVSISWASCIIVCEWHTGLMQWRVRVLPGVVRHTFIIFGLFTTPNLCPLAQNPGDATGISAILYSVVRDYLYIICSWRLCVLVHRSCTGTGMPRFMIIQQKTTSTAVLPTILVTSLPPLTYIHLES